MKPQHRYVLKRLLFTIVSLYVIATVVFLIFRAAPGDPSSLVIATGMTEEDRMALRADYGLNQPLYIQYVLYLKNILLGNFGVSFFHNTPVLPFLLRKSVNTLSLALPSIILAFTLGPLLGLKMAAHRNKPLDNYGTIAVLTAYGAPVFWTGMMAIMIFSFTFNIFPSSGMRSATFNSDSLIATFISIDFLYHAVLPIIVFSAWWVSMPALIMRNNAVDVLDSDHINLNRAEGLSKFRILYIHVARNSLLPVLHRAAIAIGLAFGGASIVIETVFGWPGLGQALWTAVLQKDYPVAQGGFLFIAFMVITMNFIVDAISAYVDPRVAENEEVRR